MEQTQKVSFQMKLDVARSAKDEKCANLHEICTGSLNIISVKASEKINLFFLNFY